MENNSLHPITPLANHLAPHPMKIGLWTSQDYPDGIIFEDKRHNLPEADADAFLDEITLHAYDWEELTDTWERLQEGDPDIHVYYYSHTFTDAEADEPWQIDGQCLNIVLERPLKEWEIEEREELEREYGPLSTDCEDYGCILHQRY